MGIRFRCPNGHKLNVKSFQAGMRGVCPRCGAKFAIPVEGAQAPPETTSEPEDTHPPEEKRPPEVRVRPPTPGRGKKSGTDPLGEDPDAVWYVRSPGGGQFGPAGADAMRAWIEEGRVTPDSLVWREGWRDWVEAVTVFPKLARVRWSPDNSDSTSKRPSPPPASEQIAKKRSAGRRRIRSAREVKNRQVTIVVALSVLAVAMACVLVLVLMRGA